MSERYQTGRENNRTGILALPVLYVCVQYTVLVHIPLNVLNEKLISYHNKVHELWKKRNSYGKSMKIPKG